MVLNKRSPCVTPTELALFVQFRGPQPCILQAPQYQNEGQSLLQLLRRGNSLGDLLTVIRDNQATVEAYGAQEDELRHA